MPTVTADPTTVPRIEPPPLEQQELAGELKNIAEPEAVPERTTWEPRQEILASTAVRTMDGVFAVLLEKTRASTDLPL